MTVIQKTIGRLPVNLGDYDSTRAYGKKNRVLLYGCEWESKVDNNTYAPAALNTTTGVITPDTTHWKLISGSYNTWLIDNGYQKLDASNVKDGNQTQHEVNAALAQSIDTEAARALAAEQGLQDDYDALYALYQTLEDGSIIPVAAADWPVSNPQQNVIYRVANSATPTAYNDYMYNGTNTILLADFTFPGIDSEPTPDSTNLAYSGGIAACINKRIDESWLYGGHIANNYSKDNCTFEGGVISCNNGNIIEGGSGVWKYSDYLPIEHSNGIFLLTHDMYGPAWGIAFYDKNRVYCGGHGYTDGDSIQHSITIPINAKFFRFSINRLNAVADISVSFDVTFENSIYGGLRQIIGNDDISVYGLGDSTNSDDAQRLGTAYDNYHFSATKVIAKRLNAANYVNYSVPGTGVAFAYLKSQEIPNTATIVVIVVGINDLIAGDTIGDIDTILAIENVDNIPEDTILGIYVKMVKKLRARLSKNAQIVCVSPYFYESTTIRADLVTFREGIRKMCWSIGSRKGMRFIDGCDVGINPSNYCMLCRDAAHPMMEGQTVIASHILEHITPPSIAAEQYDLTDGYLPIVVNPYIPLVPE